VQRAEDVVVDTVTGPDGDVTKDAADWDDETDEEDDEDPADEADELGTVLDDWAEAVSADQPSTTRHTEQQTDILYTPRGQGVPITIGVALPSSETARPDDTFQLTGYATESNKNKYICCFMPVTHQQHI